MPLEVIKRMKFSIQDVIDVVEGKATPGRYDQVITSVIIDSRRAVPGSLFVAFTGENTDGHTYLADSFSLGAVAALVEQDVIPPAGMVAIKVSNTQNALQRLSAWQRRRFDNLRVMGITGSSGKTTTKELVAGVISQRYSVLKTKGNHNNEIGLPLTMFEIENNHDWAVLELGMGGLGEIRQLCQICKPGIGIITNIGEAHIAHLGSKEAILKAKFELAQDLAPPSLMILNGDDDLQRRRVEDGLPGVDRVVFYGLNEGNDVRAINLEVNSTSSRFDVLWGENSSTIDIGLPGLHNISNALAAFAAGLALDIPAENIVLGLALVKGEKRRLQSLDINGMTVIDDSYNANPDSSVRALEVLGSYPSESRKVAFLGDMLELGDIAPEKHQMLGKATVDNDVQLLVAVGEFAGQIKHGAIEAGMDENAILTFPDSNSATSATIHIKPGDIVLIKGSLGVKMDTIVQFLKDGGQSC